MIGLMDAVFFPTGGAFREWLENSHDRETELLLGFFKKGSGRVGVAYQEALDEALCFGWIDGVRKNLDKDSYTIRFTPRKPRSIWSEVNRKRVAELLAEGRMEAAGRTAFARAGQVRARQYSFENPEPELAPEYREELESNRAAAEYFEKQAPSYRRVVKFWIMSAKKEETRLKRLAEMIEDCANGKRIDKYTLKKKDGSGPE
jgi:uncharacterized protein YdeI (YjbR/CyaY-like superfamily)